MENINNVLSEAVEKLLCSLTDEVIKGLHECMSREIIFVEVT